MNILKFDDYVGYKGYLEARANDASSAQTLNETYENDDLIAEAKKKVDEAVLYIVGKYKFFATFIFDMRTLYTYRVPTMATDGRNIFVNPKFTVSLTDEEVTFVICHEIMHSVLDHFKRADNMRLNQQNENIRRRWNIAGDHELNILLVDEGLITGDHLKKMGACYDEKWFDVPAEIIYERLSDSEAENDDDPNGADYEWPANVGDYVRMMDGSFGVIERIQSNGDYEIREITKADLDKAFGLT